MDKSKQYVNIGCGHNAPKEWVNFDFSLSTYIRSLPLIGELLKFLLKTTFPKNARCGDIVKGLPLKNDSCDAVFSSHTFEHLALEDFRKALKNTHKIMKTGAVFRCVVPDLEVYSRTYLDELSKGNENAAIEFMKISLLGMEAMPKGLKKRYFLAYYPGMARHLWMWDKYSFIAELKNVGFRDIRECSFNDSSDEMFKLVESAERFNQSVAIECRK